MTDRELAAAGEVLLFDPAFLNPRYDGTLWVCASPEDVYAQGINAVCFLPGRGPEDLKRCRPFLNQFDCLFVAVAEEKARKALAGELRSAALGKPVWVPPGQSFRGCASLAELKSRHGTEALESLPMDAVELPAYGLIDLSDVDVEEGGRRAVAVSGISTLDGAIGGFGEGELSVWTGRRGEGKSTLLSQLLLEAIDQGERVFAYSGELPKKLFKRWTLVQAAGSANLTALTDPVTGRTDYAVDAMKRRRIDEWWRGRYFLYDLEIASAHDEGSVLSMMDYANLRYGCKVFLVDNAMTMRFRQGSDSDYYRAQSAFVGRLSEFAKRHSCHVHLVAHPRKSEGKALAADDVGGSGDIVNRADNAFAIERLPEAAAEQSGYTARLSILKNRQFGARKTVGLTFLEDCRRFSGLDGVLGQKHYGWENGECVQQIVELPPDGNDPWETSHEST
ncbi:AAA family ATPase [Oscillibacter sp. MSJ-2]|uniref:AAA family ATPase n=1 Tax=Dysosmobacter acutus TaxID=2841504 RepID=A0ABS6F8K8_9FIRM|nr:AAA family ATPase [Dysosmobacter acutus]MBU5626502.1 AAA family ATPase [Dysosmobacter acutus]